MYISAFGNQEKMRAIQTALTNVGIKSEFYSEGGNLIVKDDSGNTAIIIEQDLRYLRAEKARYE